MVRADMYTYLHTHIRNIEQFCNREEGNSEKSVDFFQRKIYFNNQKVNHAALRGNQLLKYIEETFLIIKHISPSFCCIYFMIITFQSYYSRITEIMVKRIICVLMLIKRPITNDDIKTYKRSM